MARARVEWIQLGEGDEQPKFAQNVVRNVVSALAPIAVTTTATAAGARPTAPAFDRLSRGYCRVVALDGSICVAWGSNPTATELNSMRVAQDGELVFPVVTGWKLSFIEVS